METKTSHQFLIYLSKEWRKVLPRPRTRSADVIAEQVGNHVSTVIRANTERFPNLAYCKCYYVKSYYTPGFDSPPWEWWNRVRVELVFEPSAVDVTQVKSMLLNYLPENTHIEELPDVPATGNPV